MLTTTDDLRIKQIKELSTPEEVMREIPRTLTATRVVTTARNAIHASFTETTITSSSSSAHVRSTIPSQPWITPAGSRLCASCLPTGSRS